jgi:NADH-quinone oxidoreductase subunit M
LLCVELNTAFFGTIAFLGAIDASLKLWGQSDLKKLVAYCTVQEMNLIVVAFVLGDTRLVTAGMMFSAAHAFLSTLMFYLVDCIYRRTHSRSVYQVQGLLHRTPNLGIAVFLMCVLYAGLPGTIKFSCEFLIFSALAESSFCTMVILMFAMNVLGLIGFSKPWFNVIFGLPGKDSQQPLMDLSRRELALVGFPIFSFFIFTYIAFPLI